MQGPRRAQKQHRVPVVLAQDEVKTVLSLMEGTCRLMTELMYGTGLHVHECVTLRIKDVDFPTRTISVRNSKGSKERTTVLPAQLGSKLQQHLLRVATQHNEDLARGAGLVPMPDALSRNYPSSSSSFAWQCAFPSTTLQPWGDSGRLVRWHTSDATTQRAFKKAVTQLRFTSTPVHIACATPSPPICWQPAPTFGPSSCCWGIAACRPQ